MSKDLKIATPPIVCSTRKLADLFSFAGECGPFLVFYRIFPEYAYEAE